MSTDDLANNGAIVRFTVEGLTPPLGKCVLVTSQTQDMHSGTYALTAVGGGVTSWVLTRAIDRE